MFAIDGLKVLEIIARVSLIYIACLVLLRVTGRRQVSELSQMDLLAMLLISETVSPALTGGEETITGGVIAAATLFLLCLAPPRARRDQRRTDDILPCRAGAAWYPAE